MIDPKSQLMEWQVEFVNRFLSQPRVQTLLVGPPGGGKTTCGFVAASRMLEERLVDYILVITSDGTQRHTWDGLVGTLGNSLENIGPQPPRGTWLTTTIKSLLAGTLGTAVGPLARTHRWLLIADNLAADSELLAPQVRQMLTANTANRILILSDDVPIGPSVEREIIEYAAVIASPAAQNRIARLAPSVSLIHRCRQEGFTFDAFNSREFEKLIATLLEKDGYQVELTRGTKDGGVDIVAVKNLGIGGHFKSVWQAKKYRHSNKVGISVVRELADSRQEFGASKGILVTSSYLTRGALDRIERERYLLGKVDRQDLNMWIERVLSQRDD